MTYWQSPPTARETAERAAYFASRTFEVHGDPWCRTVSIVRETIYGLTVYWSHRAETDAEYAAVLAVTIPANYRDLPPLVEIEL